MTNAFFFSCCNNADFSGLFVQKHRSTDTRTQTHPRTHPRTHSPPSPPPTHTHTHNPPLRTRPGRCRPGCTSLRRAAPAAARAPAAAAPGTWSRLGPSELRLKGKQRVVQCATDHSLVQLNSTRDTIRSSVPGQNFFFSWNAPEL